MKTREDPAVARGSKAIASGLGATLVPRLQAASLKGKPLKASARLLAISPACATLSSVNRILRLGCRKQNRTSLPRRLSSSANLPAGALTERSQ